MFERFTEAARRLLFFARYEVSQLGGSAIESEHLLLGLLRGKTGVTARLFAQAHVSAERLRDEVVRAVDTRETFPTSVEVPFTEETKRILQSAADEADRLQSVEIDTEHVLLGMLGVRESLAASLLTAQGMDLEAVRRDIVRLQNEARERRQVRDSGPAADVHEVHIVPTRRTDADISRRGNLVALTLEGFSLRAALSRVCNVHETRIDLPASLDENRRYDFSVPWFSDQRRDAAANRLIREGIERHFQVSITHQARSMDVYVLTAPEIGFSRLEYASTSASDEEPVLGSGAAIDALSASNATMEQFCHQLEHVVDRLVLDETALDGRFDFHLRGHASTIDELRELLYAQLQLRLTPATRDVMMLVVRPKLT